MKNNLTCTQHNGHAVRMLFRALCLALLLAATAPATAQIKLGGKKIDLGKAAAAVSDVVNAATLSDGDIARMSSEYMEWMDTHNPLASPESELGRRLDSLTRNIADVNGIKPNFGVYEVVDVNAFACGDGSIRVCAGLMEIMDDNEVLAVIGHELGHVCHTDTKDAMKNAYLMSAAKNAAGAADGTAAQLTESELGSLAEAFTSSKFSRTQENAADDYAFEFSIQQGIDPYSMANALNKLVELSGGSKSGLVQKMFSSHPDSAARAARMKEKADAYVAAQQ